MRTYQAWINGEFAGTVEALDYQAAKRIARATFRISCDIIG